MRRVLFFIAIFLFTLSSVMGQMIPINLPADGNWPTIVGDSIMIIGPRQNELTEEQRYFNPVYLMTYPGKEHLKAQMIRAGACDCDPTIPNRRIGVFSVAPDKKVSFSQGNLQYLPAINLWKFANTQYEYLGNANKYLKPTFRNWVDLFGWSANNTTAPFGVSTSTNAADYAGDFVDWGTNTICGDAPGTWRTLSVDEWEYLLNGRENAAKLMGHAQINEINGFIFLPDDWHCPNDITFQPGVQQYADQTFTIDQWTRLEQAGAVFLPAAGRRGGTELLNLNEYGNYWSATLLKSDFASYFAFNNAIAYIDDLRETYFGRPVRLVHDTIVSKTPKRIGIFSVASDKQVSFSQGNLQYIQSTDTWRFAREQYEYIGAANIKDGALADRIDMFGWSGKDSKVPFGVGASSNYKDYQGEFVDWGTNTISGDAPDTWRTLSIEEWEYIYHGRENADQLLALATLEGVPGLILLPDNWQQPEDIPFVSSVEQGLAWDATRVEGSYFDASNKDHTKDNIYTQAQWQKMEALGAVFVPCAGWRQGNTWLFAYNSEIKSKYCGSYWSCTIPQTSGDYYFFRFTQQEIRKYSFNSSANPSSLLARGRSVRLVHDTIVPETIPAPCLIVKVNDTLSINMMCVEGGTFQMGATPEMDPDALAHEAPVHSVTLSVYYIGQIEVTQALWKTVMGTNPSTIKDNNRPVNNVSWEDCQVFIEKLNQKTGYSFRLPTEAEWEYAARGGNKSRGYKYAGSDNIDEVAWYKDNSGGKYQPSALKKPNELGIYDMSGNVFEWCQDWYGPYSADAQVNPQGPESGPYHMIRGGGWKHIQSNRVTYRRTTGANLDITSIGLRLVLDDTALTPPEPEYVDLGLSVKWATFNVGASKPEDYGDYFAWGETEPKETYSWATYKWCDGTQNTMTKYNATDGKTILEPADDAAQVHWGGKWRMPTEEEQQELIDRCSWERTNLDGVIGYKVTGPNGNSIFIPIAGAYNSFDNQLNSVGSIGWIYSSTIATEIRAYEIHIEEGGIQQKDCSRCVGLTIRPVYDDRPTLTVIPTPEDAKVSFLCKGYQAVGHSITVDKGKDVLYQVTNVDAGYLSQGDSIYNLTKDSVLYVTLRPFSDGNWVKVNKSEYTKQEGYYVSRNNGGFASHSVWNYYVLPVLPGETYRVRGIAGQHAALWIAASTAPDAATNTRPTKISCCANRGVAAYVADEVTIPDGAKYLIINSRNGKEMMVERKVPDPCLVVKINDTLSINMMCVEGGTFTMGDGGNAHQVSLSSYSIGQTEVTQALWETVMGTNPSANTANKQLPVTNISWYDCQEFIKKLNQQTGMRFRLPTEAEWEYAARGGQRSKGYTYAGSNDINDVAWYVGNAGAKSHIVGTKLPNELGIFDMSGNIWEWCAETFDENDDGQEEGAVHGGAWDSQASTCRVISSRAIRAITYAVKFIGFRLVHDADFTQSPEPEYVDLGLSVKWATFNVGATSPEDDGDYFAWGETETKETYSWATYKWGTSSNLTKYNTTDGKTILDLDDDAAYVNWGDKWRMPSKEEVDELTQQCNWIWTTHNNVNGYKVTGPNGNSIFLPAAGYKGSGPTYPAGEDGLYWTNTIEKRHYSYLIVLHEDAPPTQAGAQGTRCFGFTIRAVYDDRP